MASTRVDDRSSSITFSGTMNGADGWGRGGAPIDYNNSVTYATLGGLTATLTFRGTSIAVYGHIMRNTPTVPPPVSSYSIDGGSPTTYTEFQDDVEHPNQRFYQSPTLPNGQHTLVLTYLYDNHAALFLDYFLVVAGDDTPTPQPPPTVATVTPPNTPGSSSTTSRPSASSVVSAGSLSRSVSLSTSMINGTVIGTVVPVTVLAPPGSITYFSMSSSTSTTPSATMAASVEATSSDWRRYTGIIIGASVGGVAIIALAAVVVYCWFRKRRRDQYDWRKVSGFANQPSSQWYQQVQVTPTGRTQSKFPQIHAPPSDNLSHDRSTVSGRPPSYSQEPPQYTNPQPSKFIGYLDS